MNRDILGTFMLLAYYLIFCLTIPTFLKVVFACPNELVRKMQHIAYSLSIFILITQFTKWYFAVGAASILIILGYPLLLIFEKSRFYSKFLVDRRKNGGELRMQLLLVQLSFAVLILVFWGLLGEGTKYIIPVGIMAWGFGDAAAAVFGKAFGKKVIKSPYVDGPKTYIGLHAMTITASLAIFLSLTFYMDLLWWKSLLIAAMIGPLCGIIELFSKKGSDTITVPSVASFSIYFILRLFEWWGW